MIAAGNIVDRWFPIKNTNSDTVLKVARLGQGMDFQCLL